VCVGGGEGGWVCVSVFVCVTRSYQVGVWASYQVLFAHIYVSYMYMYYVHMY